MGTSDPSEVARFEQLIGAVLESPETVPGLIQSDPLMLEATNQSAETALHWFAVENNVAAIELLLKLGAKIPDYALQHAIEAGNVEAVKTLLNAGAAMSKYKFITIVDNPIWELSSGTKARLMQCFEGRRHET